MHEIRPLRVICAAIISTTFMLVAPAMPEANKTPPPGEAAGDSDADSPADAEPAQKVDNTAAAAGSFEDGQAAFRSGDYATALRLFRPLAEQGHAKAQVNLGTMYFMGQGVPQDYAEAVHWLRLAAGQEDDDAAQAFAQVKLGGMYAEGEGVPQDNTEAARWYRLAAEQGRYEAQVQLGVMYAQGKGVPQDHVQAYGWFSRALPQVPASEQHLRDQLAYLLDWVASQLPPDHAQADPKPGEIIVLSVEKDISFNGDVPLWQSKDARLEGFRLVAEGVHRTAPNTFLSLVSCAPPAGTKAEIISYDSGARNGLGVGTVKVTEGQHSGCTGTVTREQMSPTSGTNQVGAGSTSPKADAAPADSAAGTASGAEAASILSDDARAGKPAETPPVQPQVVTLVAEFSGSGIQSTRPFTVKGLWEVQWSSDSAYLAIMLKKPDEPDGFPKIIANQQGSGTGSSYQPQGGTYYLETNAMGGWDIKVVEIGDGHTWGGNSPGTGERVATPSEQVEAPQPPIPPAPPQDATPESAISKLPPSETASDGNTITAAEIAAGISRDKTELEQETWWDEHMGGKTHEISGVVTDVEKGTFSGYWVDLDIGRNIRVRCGFSKGGEETVKSLRKGSRLTCKGKVGNTWTSIFGVVFSMESGT